MRRSEAARYARWSAALALLLASLTAGVYLSRSVRAWIEKKKAPPPAPVNVERLSSGLTFSKVQQNQKIFTVEASKSTDFKDKEASLIEDVKITIFGKGGERHDIIHTQSCQYEKHNGGILCNGEVQIDLQSAVEADRAKKTHAGPAQTVHVETRGVTFNRMSGEAQTSQPVKFVFPDGSGEAVGVVYKSEEGTLRLLRDVHMRLKQPPANGRGKNRETAGEGDEVLVQGSHLDFGRDTRVMHLLGPVEAETRRARLMAGELTLSLDAAFHARKLVASAGAMAKQPELSLHGARDDISLRANTLTAQFVPEGWLEKLEANGGVAGARHGTAEEAEFHADAASLEMWPRVSQAKELNLNGSVTLKTFGSKGGETRMLQTSALRIEFSGGKEHQANRPAAAETLAAGTMEWTDAAAQAGGVPARTKLRADKLALDFGPQGKPQQLHATGNVQTDRAVAGRPVQTATAKSGVAQLLATGGWSQMDLQGDVRLKEGDRSAQADQAVFARAAQTAALTGHAMARDLTTETRAPRITFAGATGDIRAEGGVRSTDLSPRGGTVQIASAPANLTADTLQANSKTGRALYKGRARLWQGDCVLEAESIELRRETRALNATGNVRAVFPQLQTQSSALQAPAKKPTLWHVTAGALTYLEAESRAHLEKNVVVQSAQQRIRAPALDLYFTRSGQGAAAGAQQISRAVGTGGVIVENGTRTATSERGEYTAAEGKFVMSGGNPTLFDASEGTTTGRQLTFFLADDTIIVDSENGSRTLTKHRVEK